MKLRSNGLMVAGRPAWDPLLVFCRLRLMAEITSRCPLNGRDRPGGYKSGMPEPVREAAKMDYAAERPVMPSLPTAREISLRDETIGWLQWVQPVDRVILWGYALGKSSRAIEAQLKALRVGLSYRAVQDRFARVLEQVAGFWSGQGWVVDDMTVVEAQRAVAAEVGAAAAPRRRTPVEDGIAYMRAEREAYNPVGDSRVMMVAMPARQYRKRAVEKSASQTSQNRA